MSPFQNLLGVRNIDFNFKYDFRLLKLLVPHFHINCVFVEIYTYTSRIARRFLMISYYSAFHDGDKRRFSGFAHERVC